MSDERLFGRRGQLNDFEGRPGDPQLPNGRRGTARRMAGRALISSLPNSPVALAPGFTKRGSAVLIETGDLGRVCAIAVQMRFANIIQSPNFNASLPFTATMPIGAGTVQPLLVKVSRGMDELSPVTVDGPATAGYSIIQGESPPFDIIMARSLRIEASSAELAPERFVWVEASATIVDGISPELLNIGFTQTTGGIFTAANTAISPVTQQVLGASNKRTQFQICNTSLDSDCYINFGAPPVIATGTFTMVLPKGAFNVYESPLGGFKGAVHVTFLGGVPGGGVVVTSGSYL